MMESELYQSIFMRKSIREYDVTPLPETTLNKLKEFTGQVRRLDENIRYAFVFIGPDDVINRQPVKAPHYICFYSEKKDNYLINAGFILQQIDLYFSACNLGSCWLGLAKPSRKVIAPEGLEYVIMLCFGNTDELLHRSDTSVFNRKNMSSISRIAGADELLEPVRLAPSAGNSQPWFFSGTLQNILVCREKPYLKTQSFEHMNLIDIGIAMSHLWLSLHHMGKNVVFSFQTETVPGDYECLASALIES